MKKNADFQKDLEAVAALHLDEHNMLDAIKLYDVLIKAGEVPPINILEAIGKRFNVYLGANGSKTLDQAFNLSPKQGVGHPINAAEENKLKDYFLILVWCITKKQGISVSKAIDELLVDCPNLKYHLPTTPTIERLYSVTKPGELLEELAKTDPDKYKNIIEMAVKYLVTY